MEDRILEIMREVFEMEDVSTTASQKNCERWDSLHHLTLASEIEDSFDIDLEPEEIAEMTDFSRVVEMVKSKL
ncbi:MAG: acyl carrier protein [Muribaculaceae bacterium]|nr:acyl carrier protein [Muribaculaceae bacterium]